MLVLLVSGLAKAVDERGNGIVPTGLDRKQMGKTIFRLQAITINAAQRLAIRKLYSKAGIVCKSGEESLCSCQFLDKMLDQALAAGGEAPKPAAPNVASLEQMRGESGNEQLKAIYDARQMLADNFDEWSARAAKIDARWPGWRQIEEFAKFAKDLPGAESSLKKMDDIRTQGQLLIDPDPIAPLAAELARLLRDELNKLQNAYQAGHAAGMERLLQDANWNKLQSEQQKSLLAGNRLDCKSQPQIAVGTAEEILATLRANSPQALESEIAALSKRFSDAAESAAKIFAPDTQYVSLPRRTLANEADIAAWLAEAETLLRNALQKGPVVAK